jgi:DNA modification methylase
MGKIKTEIIQGDSKEILKALQSNSIDLIITSPPYADRNVLHLSTECNNKNHSAAFPDALPEWFIKLFTKENDTVLDPFAGSGTTLRVAKNMHRNSIGIEIMPEYIELVKSKAVQKQLNLL